MNAAALTRRVKEKALELGFRSVGVAAAAPAPRGGFFLRWLEDGRHGGMEWLAREPRRRIDPRNVLPGARSILCVTMDYHPVAAGAGGEIGGLHPHVSVYARNQDYHEVVGPALRTLLAFVRAEAGGAVDGRAYVDTGPVLEREAAAAAGLGWVGKNTQVLDRRGSWFFLGELLLEAELVPDGPVTERCGSCTACVEACPTGALAAPYLLDARRCISYLNIELRGGIPPEQRPQLGQHLFGCDICQDVCPWNRFAPPVLRPEFAPGEALRALELADLLAMGPEEFVRAFGGSPLKRARRRGLLRNAAVVMGNRGDPDAVPALAGSLRREPEAMVRGHAAWALGRLGGKPARAALQRARTQDPDAGVREEAAAALEGALPAGAPAAGGRPDQRPRR